jgi:hypothetical protein
LTLRASQVQVTAPAAPVRSAYPVIDDKPIASLAIAEVESPLTFSPVLQQIKEIRAKRATSRRPWISVETVHLPRLAIAGDPR